MPLSSSQLAALVDRAKAKTPPTAPASPPRPRQAVPAAPPAHSPATTPVARPLQRLAPAPPTPRPVPPPPQPVPPSPPLAAKTAEPAAARPAVQPDDFPTGWQLKKESWHFHRKFFRKFRRPMRQGEYSFLLRQVWQRRGEHLGGNYWRVTLPDDKTTLVVTATRWQLGTILPKGWTPPEEMESGRQPCTEDA